MKIVMEMDPQVLAAQFAAMTPEELHRFCIDVLNNGTEPQLTALADALDIYSAGLGPDVEEDEI